MGTMNNREAWNARKLPANGDRYRIAYNAACDQFRDAPSDTPILPATMRSEAVLSTQQSVSFQILDGKVNTSGGQTTVRSSERRLSITDAFYVLDIMVAFGNELTSNTTPGNVILQTWENPATVAILPATVGGFGANAAALIECYNGWVDMQVDTVQYLNGLDMLNFKRVDTAQAGTLLFTASNQSQSYFDGGKFFPMNPFVNLTGRSSITFTVTWPDSQAFTAVASNRVIAYLLLRGLRIANGAQYL